ncbi:MAG: sulfotransferase [Solirubrobacteraceae bacterium]
MLFIGGHNRSGSTMLSRLLGQYPSVVSVGELSVIGSPGWQSDQLCSCGAPFKECVFWQDVIAQAAGSSPDQWYARLAYLKKRVERFRYIPTLALTQNDRNHHLFTTQNTEYITMLGKIMSAVASVAGVSTIIDSSKYPPYGFFLANWKRPLALAPLRNPELAPPRVGCWCL